MATVNGSTPRNVPPSRFQRDIPDEQTGSRLFLDATTQGVTLGPKDGCEKEISGYPGGVSYYTEKLTLYVPQDGSATFKRNGGPLRISCDVLDVLSAGGRGVLSTRGVNGTGESEKNGGDGGAIEVYVGKMFEDLSKMVEFAAQGGNGADLPAQAKSPGGNGGKGGNVTAFCKFDLASLITALLRMKYDIQLPDDWTRRDEVNAITLPDGHWALKTVSAKLSDIKRLYASQQALVQPLLQPLDDLLKISIAKGAEPIDPVLRLPLRSPYRLAAAFNDSLWQIDEIAARVEKELYLRSTVKGGVAGKKADLAQERGLRGDDGLEGVINAKLLGRESTSSDVLQAPFVFAHPLQCKMVLEKADNYMYLGASSHRTKARALLESLLDRLSFLTQDFIADLATGNPALPLARAYVVMFKSVENGQQAVRDLMAIYNKASDLYFRSSSTTVDYYGHQQAWVPRTGYTDLNRLFDESILQLEKAEDVYLKYLNEYEQQAKTDAHVATVSAQTDAVVKAIEADLKQLNEVMTAKYISITTSSRKDSIMQAQKEAQNAMDAFKDSIGGTFKISPKSFLFGMVNFASGPTKFLGAVQGAALVYEGFTSVPSTSGEPVPKDVLLKQIKKGGDNVGSLKSEMLDVAAKSDGTFSLNAEYTTKVLTTLQAMENLIDEFADDTFGSSANQTKASLKAYAAILMAYNGDLVEYNLMLKTAVNARSQINQLQLTKLQLEQGRLNNQKNTTQDLDSMTKLLERIFDTSRARVMRLLNFLQRSLTYRTLSAVDFMDEALSGRAGAGTQDAALSMTSPVLRDLRMSLSDQLFNVQEREGVDRSLFPSDFENGSGYKCFLSQQELARLVQEGFTQVTIPPGDAASRSEFRGWADVRIYRVRFWMRGLKVRGSTNPLGADSPRNRTQDDKMFGGGKVVTAKLTHTGNETIISRDGQKWSFEHSPIPVTFSYRLFPDGSYDVSDATGGDVVNFSSAMRGVNSVYSAPSPFTTWTISLEHLNTGELDWTGVSAAVLEFFGSYASFV